MPADPNRNHQIDTGTGRCAIATPGPTEEAADLVSPCRCHQLVVRVQRLVGGRRTYVWRRRSIGRRSAALNVSTIGLIHTAPLELHGKEAGGGIFSGARENEQRRC